jgi:3-hydroxyisobutyrate dehydrogenase
VPDNVIHPPATLAVIGLGKMGLPMSKRLLAAGFVVRGFDPAAEAVRSFTDFGGAATTSAAQAAQGAAAVITMLPNGDIVRKVMLDGPEPVAEVLAKGAILLEMSSSAPLATRELGKSLTEKGIGIADAPVSGGVKRAENGTLSIMLGGDGPTLRRARVILEAMGSSIFETGPLGSGHAMKALNNYVSAAGLIAACEALQVGARFGLDPELMTDILNVSTGKNNTTENKLKQFILPETYGSGFGLALLSKDVTIATELADQLGLPAPLSHAVSDFTRQALQLLGTQADHTEVDRYLKKLRAKVKDQPSLR